MVAIKRFDSFTSARADWEALEKKFFHYPFQSWWYQNLFASNFSQEYDVHILGVFEGEELLAIGGFEVEKKIVRFLGTRDVSTTPDLSQDITDFGDLLWSTEGAKRAQEIWSAITSYFQKDSPQMLQLDYVRQDSPTYTYFSNKPEIEIRQQEVSPYIALPPSWEEYLTSLSKKDRHELKRKIKRLETQTHYEMCTNKSIPDDFEQFIVLHRLSDFQKSKFMTEKMKSFFWQIIAAEKYDWDIHIYSMFVDKKEVAAVMVFTNKEQIFLYNSGFNPEFSYFSVGLLIKAFLIKHTIDEGKKVYDFLRGNERYKYDLGAKDMPLFQIKIPFA